MKKILQIVKKYGLTIGILGCYLLVQQFRGGKNTNSFSMKDLFELLLLLPPTYFLVSFLDVFTRREVMVKWMGEGSGWKGMLLSFFLGTIGIGPLYMAFPVMQVFRKKGASIHNVFIFLGAWSTTKITQIFFEVDSLGLKYTGIRLGLNLVSICCISFLLECIIGKQKEWEINICED